MGVEAMERVAERVATRDARHGSGRVISGPHTLYKYAINRSCCSSPSDFSIPGISAALVELRIVKTAFVVVFYR